MKEIDWDRENKWKGQKKKSIGKKRITETEIEKRKRETQREKRKIHRSDKDRKRHR